MIRMRSFIKKMDNNVNKSFITVAIIFHTHQEH